MSFCIRQTRCTSHVPQGAKDWSVFRLGTGDALSPFSALEEAPELAAICDELNEHYPPTEHDEQQVGLVPSEKIFQRQCKRDGKWFDIEIRGPVELALGLGSGSVVTGLDLLSGQMNAPSLAGWAHKKYGSTAVEPPKPVEKSAEEIARLERQSRQFTSITLAARALTGKDIDKQIDERDLSRAVALMNAIRNYFAN